MKSLDPTLEDIILMVTGSVLVFEEEHKSKNHGNM
jgi:hypothetical protein